MDFDDCEDYLRSILNRILLWHKKSKSLNCGLQIDKKIINVKEDPRRKTDSNFHFSQVLPN